MALSAKTRTVVVQTDCPFLARKGSLEPRSSIGSSLAEAKVRRMGCQKESVATTKEYQFRTGFQPKGTTIAAVLAVQLYSGLLP